MIGEKTLAERVVILLFTCIMGKMKEKSSGDMTFLSTNQQAWMVTMDYRECFSCQAAKMITGAFHNQDCGFYSVFFSIMRVLTLNGKGVSSSPRLWEYYRKRK